MKTTSPIVRLYISSGTVHAFSGLGSPTDGSVFQAIHSGGQTANKPSKVVRACGEALIKGPIIVPYDRHGLKR